MNNHGTTLSRDLQITNEFGRHARSAAKIAKIAQQAKSAVWIMKGSLRADAASIMDLLTLECPKGTEITLYVDDPSDCHIMNDIAIEVETGFGE